MWYTKPKALGSANKITNLVSRETIKTIVARQQCC
jgi:hypothetical protein